jgi:hypothetical protein
VDIKLVLIHLGGYPPKHFLENIEYLLRNFPGIGIDLIVSKGISPKLSNDRVRLFQYEPNSLISEVLIRQEHDETFRKGFWRYSTERLFALAEHSMTFPEHAYLHIESDVLILPGFPFDRMKSVENLCWTRYDANRDLASLVYIPNSEFARWLYKTMSEVMSEFSDLNDMLLLNKIAIRHPDKIDLFPTAPHLQSDLFCSLYMNEESEKIDVSKNFSKFEGLFDSAAIGIWMTGTDPRNHFGLRKMFATEELLRTPTYIDPSKAHYKFSKDSGLTFSQGSLDIRIFNLHIHSKDLELFGENWESYLGEIVTQSYKKRTKYDFSFRILIDLILENMEKGTLLRFLLWLPGIRTARKMAITRKLKFLR